MNHIFYNLNEALDFAESIGIDINSHSYQYEIRNNAGVVTTLGQKVGFDIDGFSEVVPLIYVHDDAEYKELRCRGHLLHLVGTTEYYYISNVDKGKYGLSSLEFIDTSYNTFRSFRTELVAPQNIGKANKTKILNWVEYVHNLEREKIAFFEIRKERRERVIATILRQCPEARVREIGKAWNKYDFVGYEISVNPKNTGVTIKWEFDGCGGIGRTYTINYSEIGTIANAIDGQNSI